MKPLKGIPSILNFHVPFTGQAETTSYTAVENLIFGTKNCFYKSRFKSSGGELQYSFHGLFQTGEFPKLFDAETNLSGLEFYPSFS